MYIKYVYTFFYLSIIVMSIKKITNKLLKETQNNPGALAILKADFTLQLHQLLYCFEDPKRAQLYPLTNKITYQGATDLVELL